MKEVSPAWRLHCENVLDHVLALLGGLEDILDLVEVDDTLWTILICIGLAGREGGRGGREGEGEGKISTGQQR